MSDSFKFALANFSRALRHHTSELEGHSGQIPQQGRVYWRLAAQPHVRNICEIGFNGGHSALLWMMANPAARVVAFDLFRNEVSAVAERHLHRHVPGGAGRLRIYKGFSQDTVGEAIADGVRCELLSIDGGHSYHSAFVDLVNARWLAAPEQHDALIDDTNANTSVSREVTGAFEDYVRMHNVTVVDRWRWDRSHGSYYKRGLTQFRWNARCTSCWQTWRDQTYAITQTF